MKFRRIALTALMITLSGCSSVSQLLNPFYESPEPQALLGEKSDAAINGGQQKAETARSELEHLATYDRAALPSPNRPVVRPAVIRLLWIPDHVNQDGDLVPAHYYYLKVLKDDWALRDSFDIQNSHAPERGNGDVSNIPHVLQGEKYAK